MARAYPRFLFSNPKNTKSPGPFVVHTIFPRFIATISKDAKGIRFPYINWWDECTELNKVEAIDDLHIWVSFQIKHGEIIF